MHTTITTHVDVEMLIPERSVGIHVEDELSKDSTHGAVADGEGMEDR